MDLKHVLLSATAAFAATSCVTSGTHQAVLDELAATRRTLKEKRAQVATKNEKIATCSEDLKLSRDKSAELASKVDKLGEDLEASQTKLSTLSQERQSLAGKVDQLQRMQAAAEARAEEYQTLLAKLHDMIDAGTLAVKIRNGRMLVQMSSDVVFPPGATRIKPAARESIKSLAQTIKQFENRRFQVVGHSDPTPINTRRFPSNWELSTQRAIEVVKLMVEAGVPPEMVNAAGHAQYDPLVPNDGPESKKMNRRVEVVFLPKLDELPGFEDVLADQGADGSEE